MSNEKPWLKFYPTVWRAGKVQALSYSEKGMYSDIFAYYWQQECSVTLDELSMVFSRDEELLKQTLSKSVLLGIILQSSDRIFIKFLDEQYEVLTSLSKVRAKCGRKGGINKASSNCQANAKQMLSKSLANVKQNPSILDLDLDIKKDTKVSKESEVYRKFAHLSITVDDNAKLVAAGYSQEQIDNTYDSIENYKKNKDYKSLYLTAKKWLAKEVKQATTDEGVSEDIAYILENERIQEERYGKHTQWYADNCT